MPSTDRKERLFEHVLRLRRVERKRAPDRDLATVRAALEQELGATVSGRFAARLLGVSHTTVRRWIEAGDLPTVFTPAGRHEVPVRTLLRLRESADRARADGRRHALEPAMLSARERAKRLEPSALVGSARRDDPHDRARRRSLAYHRVVAQELRPEVVDEALRTIWRWREQGGIRDVYADRWEEVLARPVAEVAAVLAEDSQLADDLRQSSPFAGVLSEPERRRILEEVA